MIIELQNQTSVDSPISSATLFISSIVFNIQCIAFFDYDLTINSSLTSVFD